MKLNFKLLILIYVSKRTQKGYRPKYVISIQNLQYNLTINNIYLLKYYRKVHIICTYIYY